MESYLHIKTTFNCVVKSNNFEEYLQKNNTHSFLIQSKNVNLFFYPEDSNKYLPFCFHLAEENVCGNKNVKVVTMKNNNIYLIVNPTELLTNIFEIKQKQVNFAGTTHMVYYPENSKFNVKILCSNTSIEINEEKTISKALLLTNSNSLLLYAPVENSGKHIVLIVEYNGKNYIVKKCEEVDLLEKDANFVTTYKKINDLADHAIVNSFEIKNNFFEHTKIVYNSNHPFITRHKEIIPQAFLEAIKVNNNKLARVYMTNHLSNKLTNNHLKTFFGDFVDIIKPFFPDENKTEYLLTYAKDKDKNTFYAKNFIFIFDENNKIANIEEQ